METENRQAREIRCRQEGSGLEPICRYCSSKGFLGLVVGQVGVGDLDALDTRVIGQQRRVRFIGYWLSAIGYFIRA
jgi:hypothetical protein